MTPLLPAGQRRENNPNICGYRKKKLERELNVSKKVSGISVFYSFFSFFLFFNLSGLLCDVNLSAQVFLNNHLFPRDVGC